MKHLFLHVGMYKTGTTSIQATFFANRARLAQEGLHYLDAAVSHSRLIAAAFGESGEPTPRAAALRERLATFLASAPDGRFVISGEGMGRMAAARVRPMLEILRPLVGRITVVCFLRPPRGYLSSNLQQNIRGGMPLGELRKLGSPNYRGHVEKFLDCADLADTTLPLCDRASLVRGCSIATMLAICGAPPDLYDRLELRQENSSLSKPAAALLLAMADAGLPRRRTEMAAEDSRMRRHAQRLAEAIPGPRFAVPPALIEAALNRPEAQADMRWAEERMGRPFPDRAPPPEAAAPDAAARAAAWPASELTTLPRPAVEALARTLAAETVDLVRHGASELGLARALGWAEGWLAGGAPELDRAGLAELARRLVEAVECRSEFQRAAA